MAASAISIQPSKVTMQKWEKSAFPKFPKWSWMLSSSKYCCPSKTTVKMEPVYVMMPNNMHIQSTAETDSCNVLTSSTKSRNIRKTRTKRTMRTSRSSRKTVKELIGLSSPPIPDNGVSSHASTQPVAVTVTSKMPHPSKYFLIRGTSARIRSKISSKKTTKKQDSIVQNTSSVLSSENSTSTPTKTAFATMAIPTIVSACSVFIHGGGGASLVLNRLSSTAKRCITWLDLRFLPGLDGAISTSS
mmetsp:Transcript_11832/g.26887  ORF Transcript_11832/g.26887 Transcript_11832/m.26887 type:complete len:245 (-) Transcript_11832:311-1045(-)